MIKDLVIDILNTAKTEIISNIEGQGIKASGRTQNSLKVEDRGQSIVLFSDGSGAPFTTIQYGRPAGKVPYTFEKILIQWMKDKGVSVQPIPYKTEREHKYTPLERGYMQRAYFTAKKIREDGTNRHKSPNENVYSQPIAKAVKSLNDGILKLIVKSITDKQNG
jgi:hypothetical protein